MAKKSLTENFSLNFIKTLLGIIFPLITFPYASRILGSTGIGKVNFAEAIITYYALIAGLGISAYGIREAAKCKENKKELNILVNELFTINLITTVLVYILLAVTMLVFGFFDDYRMLMIVQAASILFTTIGLEWFFTALEEYRYITVRALIFQVISLCLLFICVKDKDDCLAYTFVYVLANVGSGIMNFFYIRKFITLRISLTHSLIKHMKPILYIFGTNVASAIYLGLDKTMLGIALGDEAVGLYSGASKITKTISALLACISNVMLPRVSVCIKKNQKKQFEQLITDAGNIIFMLTIPMAIGLICISKEAITLFCGLEFQPAYLALLILSWDMIVSSINRVLAWLVLVPLGHEDKVLFTTSIGAVINLVLNFIFIPIWNINGAALSTLISEIAVFAFCMLYAKNHMNICRIYRFVPQYIGAGSIFFVIKYFLKAVPLHYIIIMLIQIISSSIIYFVCLLYMKNPYVQMFFSKGKSLVSGGIKNAADKKLSNR